MAIAQNNSGWLSERERIVPRACVAIERGRSRGLSVRKAALRSVWRWNGKPYRCDVSRRVRLSRSSLVQHFYDWRRNGKNPEALQLHYRAHGPKISARLVREFIRVCGMPGVRSLSDAYRKLSAMWRAGELKRPFAFRRRATLPFSRATFLRALTSEQRRTIIEMQRIEHAAALARDRFNRITSD